MKARGNIGNEREDLKDYLSQINWDGMFFKVQMVLGGILLIALVFYLMWI